MEALEEHPVHIPSLEGKKENLTELSEVPTSKISQNFPKTNGVSQSASEDVGLSNQDNIATEAVTSDAYNPQPAQVDSLEANQILEAMANEPGQAVNVANIVTEQQYIEIPPAGSVIDDNVEIPPAGSVIDDNVPKDQIDSANVCEIDLDSSSCPLESTVSFIETGPILDTNMDALSDHIQFETEVVVEKEETVITDMNNIHENEADNQILSDLEGQNIDLGEALRTETSENNNSTIRQEVFNKEELLDILEGNDMEGASKEYEKEAEIAMNQLCKLKNQRPKRPKNISPVVVKSNSKKADENSSTVTEKKPVRRRRKVFKTDQSTQQLEASNLAEAAESASEPTSVIDENLSLEKPIPDNSLSDTSKCDVSSPDKLKKENISSEKVTKDKTKKQSVSKEKPKKENSSKEKLKKETFITEKSISDTSMENTKKVILSTEKSKKEILAPENQKKQTLQSEKVKEKTLVTSLVEDWEDDEPEDEKSNNLLDESQQLLDSSETIVVIQQEEVTNEEIIIDQKSVDSSAIVIQPPSVNKSTDDGHTRRQGRIIKKKVPFDPDNPDTFTKAKTAVKTKEPQIDKEQPPASKKMKPEQITPRAMSKSPVGKTSWKKPTPKNNKQNRRLTEVDKLLMDEGAVNMIYQLTPEASNKGNKKNMRTKAELIKKINQNTPEANEMKFRERKKETLKEVADAKKVLGGKQRSSLSGSVKSMSVGEDFETHSADDSIIYRRHSSSSYSDTCLSPRRLSDVESFPAQTVAQALQQAAETMKADDENEDIAAKNSVETSDVFMAEPLSEIPEVINKNVCMNMKEKLNSKLSNVLNKRKRESKTDKPMKQKKLTLKSDSRQLVPKFKTLSLSFDNRIAEIRIHKPGTPDDLYGIQVLLELKQALQQIEETKEVSITLLMSESGSLCSSLDLRPLLDMDVEKRTNYAFKMTEATRAVLSSMSQHSKLLVCGVSAPCEGFGLAMMVLCDLAVTSDRATFALAHDRAAPLVPAVAVLTSQCTPLPHALMNELVILGRCLSASEALQRGLVSRVLWPERFLEELRLCVRDVATQSPHTLLLKKQLMKLNRNPEAEVTFQASLTSEQDMIAAYWTSVEGQETLQAYLKPV